MDLATSIIPTRRGISARSASNRVPERGGAHHWSGRWPDRPPSATRRFKRVGSLRWSKRWEDCGGMAEAYLPVVDAELELSDGRAHGYEIWGELKVRPHSSWARTYRMLPGQAGRAAVQPLRGCGSGVGSRGAVAFRVSERLRRGRDSGPLRCLAVCVLAVCAGEGSQSPCSA